MDTGGAVGGMLNWMMNSGFDIALVLLALIAGLGVIAFIVRETRRDVDGLKEAAQLVESAAKDDLPPREAFAAQYETVGATLKDHRLVGRAWRRFASTIVPLEVEDGESTENTLVSRSPTPNQYFSTDSLGLERPLVAMAPAAFLAVFMLLAGIGLAVSIGGIASAVAPDASASGDLMRTAVASAGGKLLLLVITVALFVALRLALSWSRTTISGAVLNFNGALLDRIYFENIESAGVRRQDAMHFQAKSLQRLGEKLATSIGGTTRDAIVEGYMEVVTRMEALTERYDDLVSSAQKGAREAVTKAFDESVDTSTDLIVKRMEAVAEHLSTIPERMEQASRALENAGANISSEQQRFATDLQTTATDTVASAASAVAQNVEEAVRGALAESRDVSLTISERLSHLPDRIEKAAQTFENASSQMIDVQGTVAADTQARTQQAVEAVTDMIQKSVGDIARAVDETIANSLLQTTKTLQSVGEDMTMLPDRLSGVARVLEQASDRIADTHTQVLADLKIGASEMTATTADAIIARVDENTASFIEKLNESNDVFEARATTLTGLFASLDKTNDHIAETHTRFMAQMQQATRDMTATTAQSISRSINENTATFIDKLNESNAAFEERAGALTGLFATLQKASDRIAETHTRFMTQMQDGARELTEATAETLARSVNENTAGFIDKLNESNDVFEERAEALTGLFATLQKASDRIAETHTRFMGEMQDSTRDVIAKTTSTIAAEIQTNTADIVSRLRESDDFFASRVEALSSLLPQIDQTSKALADIMERISTENGRVGVELSELAGSLHNATGDIKKSADQFSHNLLEVQQSLDHFQNLSKETIQSVGTSQRTLKESIGLQAELWQRHVERFDDVDRKLGDVFAEMSRQIDAQTRQMRDQVAEMDGALAAAVNHLGELVEELNETRAEARKTGAYV